MSLFQNLRDNPFFTDFSDDELRILADFTEEQNFKEGEVILTEQSPTTAVYFIVHGRVTIFRSLMGCSNFLTILEKNDIFGEVAFADQQARSAAANALDDTTVARFNYDHFDVIQKQSPAIGMKLLKALMRELTQKFRAVNSGIDLKSSEQTISELISSKQKVKITTENAEYICAIMYADKSGVNPFVKIDLSGQTILIPFSQIRSIALPNKYGKF
ncbi:MAG: cyclic nucleotide-binding domain-containing protein [Candidatus Riflebacteria bacterium]|jgi:CRP-like cAMP-binding protein|nr:cyclic nucleotide-binding domain-containing protein [Candidatus Riflebacteria bacterium]